MKYKMKYNFEWKLKGALMWVIIMVTLLNHS